MDSARSAALRYPTAVTAVAAEQYGAITCSQALKCGLTYHDLRRLVRKGEWLRPHRSVYVVPSLMPPVASPERLHCLIMAAQLALGVWSCAAGRTAARLWGMQGLERWDGLEVHLAVPALRARGQLTGVELHGWDVRPEQTTTLGGRGTWGNGVRVTDPGRTLLDTLPDLDRETAVCLMDSALNRRLLRKEDVTGAKRAMWGRRGCVKVRRWWELADERAESPLETRIRLICRDAGQPPDELQRCFTDRAGRTIAVADFWWEGARLIGEADGIEPHSTPRALARDRERQNALQALYPDVRIVRFTWADLNRPGYILALVTGAEKSNNSVPDRSRPVT